MPRVIPGVSRILRPPSKSELDFTFEAKEFQTVVSSSASTAATSQDMDVLRHTSATLDNGFRLYATPIASQDPEQSTTFAIAGESASLSGNIINRVSDGSVVATASFGRLTKAVRLHLERTGGETFDEFVQHRTGSLAKHVVDAMESLAAGHVAADTDIFATQDHAAGDYVRNENLWLEAVDTTAFSPWNSYDGNRRAGVAVSPRHTIHAWHYPVTVGTTLRFVTASSVVVERTVSDTLSLPGQYTTDTKVALLDSDLPASITFAKVFPSDLGDYLPTVETASLPVIGIDQQEKSLTRELSELEGGQIRANTYTQGIFADLSEEIIPGDSGNPVFLLVNGELVLLSLWTSPTTGPAFHSLLTEINAAMTTLGGGYQLTPIDLSSFTNYSV